VGVINYKDYSMQENSAVLDIERGQLAGIRPQYWQTDTSVSNKSWGYIENDTFKTPQLIVHQLVDVVSKNGNLLMNIGLRSDGTIPGRSATGAARRGFVAEGERRCDLRHSSLEDFRSWGRPRSRKVHLTTPTQGRTHPMISASPPRATFSVPSNWAGRLSLRRSFTRLEPERLASEPSNQSNSWLRREGFFQTKPDGLHIQLPEQAPGKYADTFRIQFAERK
jgi:alpha-L-fucosidase